VSAANPPFTDEHEQLRASARGFIERELAPHAREWEDEEWFPNEVFPKLAAQGLLGLKYPEELGGQGGDYLHEAVLCEEMARTGSGGTAAGIGAHINIATPPIWKFGTDEQKQRYLPAMATGEIRATMALTEPGGGSDLQALTTRAEPDGDGYRINGAKTWITNARRSRLIALLCRTDPNARPAHAGISILLVEPGPGFTVSRDLPKLGYKGVESCELSFVDYHAPGDALLGGAEGRGFAQMMRGLEIGRIQVAARALGVARAAFDDALRYAQERESFGKPIWRHQSVGNYLADMATKYTAARQLVLHAAQRYDTGERSDLEAGMAKLFASETAMEIALNAMRVHGGYGYSTEFDVERYFRDAPLMIVGEGTNEIQRNVIASQLVARGGLDR
jgi:alkylation response protein AidB-like acyl-CoA dehydrogenase